MAPLNGSGRVAARRGPSSTHAERGGGLRDALGLLLLAAFVWIQFGDALGFPFVNDDYVFLDQTRDAPLGSLWGFDRLAFHWYRPFSRELHYGLLQRAAGASEPVFHAVNLALAIAVLVAFATLVRRIAGGAASAWTLAMAAAMTAWSLPLLWVAGVQDLWMLFWALLALRAWIDDRRAAATIAFVLALLSKETAAVLPGVLLAWDVVRARRGGRASFGRLAPIALVTLVWAGVHPQLGGRLWQSVAIEAAPPEARVAPPLALLRALLVAVNLDAWPRPGLGAAALARAAAVPVLLLLALAWVRWPGRGAAEPADAMPLSWFGLAWAALGWLPLLLPGLGWHGYYALFGALGVLVALAPWVSRRRAPAFAAVALVAVLGVARAHTPSLDWGEATYQRRAAHMLASLRAGLMRLHPGVPRHSRLYFSGVPDRVGFLAGDGPSLRVWYAEPTLRGGYYSAWRPRRAGEPAGIDYFFSLDTLSGWTEVHAGPENVGRARLRDRAWAEHQKQLATAFSDGGDWAAAGVCYGKLAEADPTDPQLAFRLAICLSQAGDSLGAADVLRRAATLPGADAEIVEAARAAGLLAR